MGIVQDPASELLIEEVAQGSFLECAWLPSSSASCLFSANRRNIHCFCWVYSQSRLGEAQLTQALPQRSDEANGSSRKSVAVGPSPRICFQASYLYMENLVGACPVQGQRGTRSFWVEVESHGSSTT